MKQIRRHAGITYSNNTVRSN